MNRKFVALGAIIAAISVAVAYYGLGVDEPKNEVVIESTPLHLKFKGAGTKLYLPGNNLFEVSAYESEKVRIMADGMVIFDHMYFEFKQQNANLYNEIGLLNQSQNAVVVAPIFTITAYAPKGFYDYYEGFCDSSCINSVPIRYDLPPVFTSSANTIKVLTMLGYPFLTDIEVDRYPDILDNFDKVILLHNEYVTSTEFDAITQHPKVVYLHPNALYAEIEVDYEGDTITLIKGHDYPKPQIKNGFEWELDNSELEYDIDCINWEFSKVNNGIMLNCYPEGIIYRNVTLLKMIKDY